MKISFRELKASSKPIPIDNNLVIEMTNYFFENYFSNDENFERKFQTINVKEEIITFLFRVEYAYLNSKNFINKGESETRGGNNTLTLFCDRNYSKEKVRERFENNRKYLISIISHELTHLNDKISKKEGSETGEEDEKKYYNMNKELKAFLQQIVYEVSDICENVKFDKNNLKENDVFKLLNFSVTYRNIKKYLNDKNRKIIFQVIYKLIKSGGINDYKKN